MVNPGIIARMEAAMSAAQREFCERLEADMYSDPNSFVGPKVQWRTWRTHPDEWELDGGGPGQYWLPKLGTRSWFQQLARNGK